MTAPDIYTHRDHDMEVIYHEVDDPYQDEEKEKEVKDKLSGYVDIAKKYHGISSSDDFEKFIASNRNKVDFENPALVAMLQDIPDLRSWVELVPTAEALVFLENPEMAHYPDGTPVSKDARDFFAYGPDARFVRYRNRLMGKLYSERASEYIELQEDPEFNSISMGCGAGNSVLWGINDIRDKYDSSGVSGLFLDYNRHALRLVKETAKSMGVEDSVTTKLQNVLGLDGILSEPTRRRPGKSDSQVATNSILEHKARLMSHRKFNLGDGVGLAEYLKLEDSDFYRYGEEIAVDKRTAGLVTYLRNSYDIIESGGSLFIGNMLFDEYDQSDIEVATLVIGWPHIQPRSESAMENAFDRAGLFGRRIVHKTPECAYPLYEIQKPLDNTDFDDYGRHVAA